MQSPQFAPVVPLTLARQMEAAGIYGDYHLLIANQILADPKGWSDLIEGMRRTRDVTIIMDNGIVETGRPLPDVELLAAASAVKANVVILPDCIDRCGETIARSYDAAERLVGAPFDFLGVVQGWTLADCLICAEQLARLPISMVSVPRGLTRRFRSRYQLVKEVYQICDVPIHLLGFSGFLGDDLACANLLREGFPVWGIDSAIPIREGLYERDYDYQMARAGTAKRDANYLDRTDVLLNETVRRNVEWVRRQLQRPPSP